MSLIDQSYFISEISLPTGEFSDVNEMIVRYEFDLLVDLFGYELAKLISAYNSSTSEQRVKDIVEGKEFEVEYDGVDRLVKWRGLKNAEKKSIIAYHIYYWYHRNNVSITMSVGQIKPIQENSVNADISMKVMNASNLFYNEFQMLFIFMSENTETYPEWVCRTDLFSVHTSNSFDL